MLPDRAPLLSSRRLVFDGPVGRLPLILVAVLCLFQPGFIAAGLHLLGLAGFVVLITYRAVLFLLGRCVFRAHRSVSMPACSDCLPLYSVLLPMFREATSVAPLCAALNELRYPKDRREFLFLVEACDHETLRALRQAALPVGSRIVVAPDGLPRTKPRALNLGLALLSGDLVTVYDAEDRPHPDQLLVAAAAFRKEGERLACVQAPLRAHNAGESWIAGQWALEYEMNFGLVLPALARLGLPMALGGTSNHFRVDVLKAVGGWDAWNVTEDADLGLRLARLGWKTGVIAPPTLEEAPESFRVWMAQRSRWLKGYIQTWSVLMRRPVQAMREMGVRAFCSTQVLLGGAIVSALVHGPLLVWCVACLVVPGLSIGAISLAVLLSGYVVSALAAVFAPGRRRWERPFLVLTFVLYWPLLSLAVVRALYGVATRPHAWAKTPHGLTRHRPASDLAAFA
ncbi:MAG: glycosyltransferase [Pseudomonadota bacterium]